MSFAKLLKKYQSCTASSVLLSGGMDYQVRKGEEDMSYSEELKLFKANHTYENMTVGGSTFRYVLSGKKDGKTLVMLNGGMNTLEMWMEYVDALSADDQVLLFDYPQELRTNQELVKGMHEFFGKIGVTQPIFVGASDGGMVAQIYIQKYHGEVGGLILISTGGMDEATLKSLKKKYFFAPLMLFYMKHCNYEKLKPKLIRACMGHIRNESEEQVAYAQDMFETIFKDYTREKDVHISGLLADLMNQTPVTEADFRKLEEKILLILPDQDFFSGKMQKDLIQLMHGPEIKYVSGGHLSTVLKVDDYVQTIRSFLQKNIK